MPTTCPVCSDDFEPTHGNQVFCAPKCRDRDKYLKAQRVPCMACGQPTGYKVGVVAKATCNPCRQDSWKHGTRKGYRDKSCRCNLCQDWMRSSATAYRKSRDAGEFPETPCLEAECERGSRTRGMCTMHYKRWARANGLVKDPPWDDKARDKYHRRRARMNGARNTGRVLLTDVITRDGNECRGCGQAVDLTLAYPHPMSKSLDHVVPISRGGQHNMSNAALMHLRCNLSKGAKFVPTDTPAG